MGGRSLYMALRRLKRSSPYSYRLLTPLRVSQSILVRKASMNSTQSSHSISFASSPASFAALRSLLCRTSHAYDSRRPHAASYNSRSGHRWLFHESQSRRKPGNGLMKIQSSNHTRCSSGLSVTRILRPSSFCRCKGRAAVGRPASHK